MGATYASMYLRHSSSPSSREMHFNFTPFSLFLYKTLSKNWYRAGSAGYSLCLFLLLRELPFLEETDGVLCPCQTLGLNGKD